MDKKHQRSNNGRRGNGQTRKKKGSVTTPPGHIQLFSRGGAYGRSEHTAFLGCVHISLVGGYRRSPTAISPNLSNLHRTVRQITDGIGRTDGRLAQPGVDTLARRPPACHAAGVTRLLGVPL